MALQLCIVSCYPHTNRPEVQAPQGFYVYVTKSVSELLHFLLPLVLFFSGWLRKMLLIWLKSHWFASEESWKDKNKKSSVQISGHKDRKGLDFQQGRDLQGWMRGTRPRPLRGHLVGKSLTQSSGASSRWAIWARGWQPGCWCPSRFSGAAPPASSHSWETCVGHSQSLAILWWT